MPRPHPRLRRIAKWVGLALTCLVLGVHTASRWGVVEWHAVDGRTVIGITRGAIFAKRQWTDGQGILRLGHGSWGVVWRSDPIVLTPVVMYDSAGSLNSIRLCSASVVLPLWIPLGMVAVPAGLHFWHDRRATRRERPGFCPRCGYNRHGLAEAAACPECNAIPVAAAPATK